MKSGIELQGYVASVEYDTESEMLHGKVINTLHPILNFYAADAASVKQEFQTSLETYLEVCAEQDIEPEAPVKGAFTYRPGTLLHSNMLLASSRASMTMNNWMNERLLKIVEEELALPDRDEVKTAPPKPLKESA